MQHSPLRTCLLIGTLGGIVSAQSTFDSAPPGPVTATAGESFDAAWADVDGDGDLDLYVAAGSGAVANHLYLVGDDGGFTAVAGDPAVTVTGNSSGVAFGDLDGDGDLDLVVTNRNGANNNYFVNQGGTQGGVEGTFASKLSSIVATDGGNSRAVSLGDVDGDGDLDVFVANIGGTNALYRNQGGAQGGTEGSFTKVTVGQAVTDVGDSTDAVFCDLDGDGDLDLYVTNDGGEDDFLYFNNGAGLLVKQTGVVPADQGGDSRAVAAGDLDGDGDLELFVANFLEDNALYVNQGGVQGGTQGTWVRTLAGPPVSDGAASLDAAFADIDLDGDLDLAVANCCGQDNLLYRNDGTGVLTRVTQGPVVTDGGSSNAVVFGDYDKDGAPDLFVANSTLSGSSLDFLYLGRTAGTFARLSGVDVVTEAASSFDVAVGDVDGDGDEDVLAITTIGQPNVLWINQGGVQAGVEGEFAQQVSGPLVNGTSNGFAAEFGDLDGDGDLDLAIANRQGQDNELYTNQGGAQAGLEGDFVAVVGDPATNSGGNTRDVRLADVDGDADLDLFYANSNGEPGLLFVNQGGSQAGIQGTFLPDGGSAFPGGDSYGAEFADVDGDGDLDLFVANRVGGANVLYLNQGGSQLGTPGAFAPALGSAVAIDADSFAGSFGDLDGDGDLDLFVANDGVNMLFTNQGGTQGGVEGDFVSVTGQDPVLVDAPSRRAEWGDIDGDGDVDLSVPDTNGDNELYRSLGDGTFLSQAGSWPAGDGGNSRGAAFADLDGDEDLDLVVANFAEALDVYLNISPSATTPPPWTTLGHALAGTKGEPMLAGSGTLDPNTQAGFQVASAVPNTATTFIVGISTIFAPFKGGVLVPAPDLLVPGIPTDANGFYYFFVTWPSGVPSGSQLFFQVWMPDPLGPLGFSATNGLQATTP
ncbi:MAG: VCBS repeat-containing protein [Planctomycetes bacterium]|nr:VCBS repeat-containing protein [Planctomycetota bacterium]